MKKSSLLPACLLVATYAGAHSVTLTWDQPKGDNIAFDRVYCGHQAGGPYPHSYTTKHAVTSVTKWNAAPGSYYCVVTAIDQNGLESEPSNEVHVVVPQ